MPPSFGPEHAPVGDVGTALLCVDSRLTQFQGGDSEAAAAQHELIDQTLKSFSGKDAEDVLDGACTLMYLFMEWLRQAHEQQDADVIGSVLPYIVGTMRMMTMSVKPEAIPTMAGMMTAAALGLSPTLWRKQYGPWAECEMNALEATLVLLAEHINHLTGDKNAASRMIAEILESVTADDEEE